MGQDPPYVSDHRIVGPDKGAPFRASGKVGLDPPLLAIPSAQCDLPPIVWEDLHDSVRQPMGLSLDQMRVAGTDGFTSRWIDLPQSRLNAFAEITEDDQFIHIDPVRAADTPFGGPIAHGFLTLSMLSAMAYDALPELDGQGMGVNYGFNKLRFVAAVPAGARIRGRFVLHDLTEKTPGAVTLTWGVTIEIENSEKPAVVAEWINQRYIEKGA